MRANLPDRPRPPRSGPCHGRDDAHLTRPANRDASRFKNPDAFDIRRDAAAHVAFGYGAHFCLGAPLSRMERKEALPALLARLPNLALATAPAELAFRVNPHVRGPVHLPITFTPS